MNKREELLINFAIVFVASFLAIALYMDYCQPKPQIQAVQMMPPQMMQPGQPPFPPPSFQAPAPGQPGMMPPNGRVQPGQPGIMPPNAKMPQRPVASPVSRKK